MFCFHIFIFVGTDAAANTKGGVGSGRGGDWNRRGYTHVILLLKGLEMEGGVEKE